MTKNEIIREVTRINPKLIKSLDVIYHNHNRLARFNYVFSYEYTSHASHEILRELARVLLSLYKLRKHVQCIRVEYFPLDDENNDCISRYASDIHYVRSVSDFIKSIKK